MNSMDRLNALMLLRGSQHCKYTSELEVVSSPVKERVGRSMKRRAETLRSEGASVEELSEKSSRVREQHM